MVEFLDESFPGPALGTMESPPQPQRRADDGALLRGAGYLFFFASGASALIYETLWIRLLGLVFGNTTFAVSTVLAAYMAGLGFGSYFMGRLADRWPRPLLVYGSLEIGIGAYAALTFVLMEVIQALYVGLAQTANPHPFLLISLRLAFSLLILFIPTFFMGATLPILAKFYIRRSAVIGSSTAMLYGINTAGAVFGTLLAGFWLLANLGMQGTLTLAVMINLAVGVLACLLSWKFQFGEKGGAPEEPPVSGTDSSLLSPAPHRLFLTGLFLSGLMAMVYEVAWTRALGAIIGSSVYAFTLMLATFLFGLAFGSFFYQRILHRRNVRPVEWGWLQVVIAFSALVSLPLYERAPLFTLRLLSTAIDHPVFLEIFRFGFLSLLMFLPAFGFGAIFPVTTALYTRNLRVIGQEVGKLYLANTLGNIAGSLAAGFFLIPVFGIYQTLLITIGMGGVLGFATVLKSDLGRGRRLVAGWLGIFIFASVLWFSRNGWDPRLVTSGFHVRPRNWLARSATDILAALYDNQILFYREGLNNIVSVAQSGEHRYLKVNSKTDASNGLDMFTQLLSAHLPHLLHPSPKRTLVIGFGSGTTLAASLAHPVTQLDAVELEPAVFEAAPFFDAINRKAYKDPRVRLLVNDGRNHLLTERGRYDVIVSEPSNPWMAGTSYLFTVEFYELVRRHLAPRGIFCQWLQAYSIAPSDFQMVAASVRQVLPYVTLWQSLPGDILILASQEPFQFELDRIEDRLKTSPFAREDLASLGIYHAASLLSFFELDSPDVTNYVQGARLNTDDKLFLEFNAPKALYRQGTADLILKILGQYRQKPFLPVTTQRDPPLEKRPEVLTRIGEGFLSREKESTAQLYFEKALRSNPEDTAALIGLGRTYLAQNELLKAMHFFQTAATKDPASADAWGYFGYGYLKGGSYAWALDLLEKATAFDSTRVEFFLWKAQALEALGRFREALAVYGRLRELKSGNLSVELGYARILRQLGQFKEAVQILEPLRRKYTTYETIYTELNLAYQTLGEFQSAIRAYEELVRLNPYYGPYWLALVDLYRKTGDEKQAAWATRQGEKTHPYFNEFIDRKTQGI